MRSDLYHPEACTDLCKRVHELGKYHACICILWHASSDYRILNALPALWNVYLIILYCGCLTVLPAKRPPVKYFKISFCSPIWLVEVVRGNFPNSNAHSIQFNVRFPGKRLKHTDCVPTFWYTWSRLISNGTLRFPLQRQLQCVLCGAYFGFIERNCMSWLLDRNGGRMLNCCWPHSQMTLGTIWRKNTIGVIKAKGLPGVCVNIMPILLQNISQQKPFTPNGRRKR